MLHFFAKRLAELHEKKRDERGFTLIELLVVIIIIGILAAIAIPVFLSQREKAWAASAASELRNAAAAATACSADNDGNYDGPTADCALPADLENYGWSNDVDVTENFATANAGNDWTGTAFNVNFPGCIYSFTTVQADANTGKVIQQNPANC
jgi:type IV pilus assembly protein PilA